MSVLSSTGSGKYFQSLTPDDLMETGYIIEGSFSDRCRTVKGTYEFIASKPMAKGTNLGDLRLILVFENNYSRPNIVARCVWVKNNYPDIQIHTVEMLQALEHYWTEHLFAQDHGGRTYQEKKLKKKFLEFV